MEYRMEQRGGAMGIPRDNISLKKNYRGGGEKEPYKSNQRAGGQK